MFYVVFCWSLFPLYYCGHCGVCPSSIYGFWYFWSSNLSYSVRSLLFESLKHSDLSLLFVVFLGFSLNHSDLSLLFRSIRSRKSKKDRHHSGHNNKGETMINKTQHRTPKINRNPLRPGENSYTICTSGNKRHR
jgi:hypothetical protein